MTDFEQFLNSMESWKENVTVQLSTLHSSPSPVTMDKFRDMERRFDSIDTKLETIVCSLDEKVNKNSDKIRIIEDWKLAFTSKLSVYVAVAIFFGTIMGTLATAYLQNLLPA